MLKSSIHRNVKTNDWKNLALLLKIIGNVLIWYSKQHSTFVKNLKVTILWTHLTVKSAVTYTNQVSAYMLWNIIERVWSFHSIAERKQNMEFTISLKLNFYSYFATKYFDFNLAKFCRFSIWLDAFQLY